MEFQLGGRPTSPDKDQDRPTNPVSNPVKLRLMTLIAMLVIVLIAMKEARQPETWERLGFGAPPADSTTGLGDVERKLADGPGPGVASIDNAEPSAKNSSGPQSSQSSAELPFADALSISDRFWLSVFEELRPEGQRAWFRLLRQSRSEQPITGDQKVEFDQLFEQVERFRKRHETKLQDRLAAELDVERKKKLQIAIEDDRQFWSSTAQAVRRTISDLERSVEDRDVLGHIQFLMDKKAFAQVIDQTSMNRAIEGSAWLRAWEKVLHWDSEPANVVDRVQITSQPEAYRGERIRILGRVRAAEKIKVRKNELGIDQYFVLWVQQTESPLAPYCIYTLSLPEGFPPVNATLESMDEPAKVEGVFFKLRSYLADNQQVEGSPLILARSFEWTPRPVASSGGLSQESMYRWLGTGLLICLLIACGLAFWAYKSSQMPRFKHGQRRTNDINTSLRQLASHNDILSDREKVASLESSSAEPEE